MEFKGFLPLFGHKKLDFLLVIPEIKEIYLLYLNVEVAEPLVDVAIVLLLYIFELIGREVNFTVENGHLELASVDLEFTIDDREGAPTDNNILRDILFRGQIYYLEHDNV